MIAYLCMEAFNLLVILVVNVSDFNLKHFYQNAHDSIIFIVRYISCMISCMRCVYSFVHLMLCIFDDSPLVYLFSLSEVNELKLDNKVSYVFCLHCLNLKSSE